MNQILGNNPKIDLSFKKYKLLKFKIIFFFFIILLFTSIILYFFLKYNSFKKEKVSKNLINNFNITTLYSSSNNYTSKLINTSLNNKKNYSDPFVIGLIKIDKINLMYPILSNVSEDSLNISPCRFYGPMPNEVGNLCIAGHNNANNKLFGKLDLLNLNDIITIYDLNGTNINYYIYDIKKINSNDISCTNQNTNGKKEISLLTCNNITNSRLLIKAKEDSR